MRAINGFSWTAHVKLTGIARKKNREREKERESKMSDSAGDL